MQKKCRLFLPIFFYILYLFVHKSPFLGDTITTLSHTDSIYNVNWEKDLCFLSLKTISVIKGKKNKEVTRVCWLLVSSLGKRRRPTMCAWSEQEVWFRCRMRLVNQTLGYHKQCDDIRRGRETLKERKRLTAFSALQWRQSLPGFTLRILFPLPWKTIVQKLQKNSERTTK